MKLTVSDSGDIQLEEVYNPILLVSKRKEKFAVCMRDDGFEFSYKGEWYEAKDGEIRKMGDLRESSDKEDIGNVVYPIHPDLKNLSESQVKFLEDLKQAFPDHEVRFTRGERIVIDNEIVPGILCNTIGRLPYDVLLSSTIDLIKHIMKTSNRWKKKP